MKLEGKLKLSGFEGLYEINGGPSDFLGDPPQDPRFLASLGAIVGKAPSLICS